MKISRLAISSVPEVQRGNESFLNYILPCKEAILDFYSDREFTLIVSSSGDVWVIGNFFQETENPFEYRSLGFKLSVQMITSNGTCALMLTNQGKVFGMGSSRFGILEAETCSSPVQISILSLKKVVQFSISSTYAGCVDEQGSSFIWGTFETLELFQSFHQINDAKSFTCKELCTRDDFFVLCTDGGFVYYSGSLGNHRRPASKELVTFAELEDLCIVQVTASESFVAVRNENNEIFAFDACHQLIKVNTLGPVDCIMANKDQLIAFGPEYLQRWSNEGQRKSLKANCPMKDWTTKVLKINEKFEVVKVKAMNHIYGLVFNSETYEKIEGVFVNVLSNEGNICKKNWEIESKGFKILFKVFQKIQKKKACFAFNKIFQVFEQKLSMRLIINHSKLPYSILEIFHKQCNRCLMTAFLSIKNEIADQDLAARERIKRIRAANKLKQEKVLSLFKVILEIHSRNSFKMMKISFQVLGINKEISNLKRKKVLSLFSWFRMHVLSTYTLKWRKTTNNSLRGLERILIWLKKMKTKRKKESFSLISSRATFKVYLNAKKFIFMQRLSKSFHSKSTRISFNIWKAVHLKQKAQVEREFKKHQLSIKLGCKFLFPVIEFYLSNYWSIFKLNSSVQVKSRYKHFAQFIHYFIKKKMVGFWAVSFLRISGVSASLSISPEDSQLSFLFGQFP
jgi:hypothetical protein